MEIRITYRNEIYIKGKNLDEIRRTWENVDIEPNFDNEKNVTGYNFIEVDSVEDADTYDDLTEEFE